MLRALPETTLRIALRSRFGRAIVVDETRKIEEADGRITPYLSNGATNGPRAGGTETIDMQRDLVERAAAGDQAAFESLIRSSAGRLFATAHRILRDHHLAEDALQATLVTIWDELPRLRDPDRFDAWTYRLIVRASIAQARARAPWRTDRPAAPRRRGAGGRDRQSRSPSAGSPTATSSNVGSGA